MGSEGWRETDFCVRPGQAFFLKQMQMPVAGRYIIRPPAGISSFEDKMAKLILKADMSFF